MIGERLKHAFTGNTAWILSYREECFDQIGLKATSKIPLFNGALECEFRQYEIFDGKYKEFRAEGEELSKERKEFRPASGERKEFKPEKDANSVPDSVERDVNSVAKDASSTANADQENSRTAKSANSVRVKEESSRMGKDGSSDRGKDVNSVENAEQGRVSLTRKAKEERRERRKKNNTNNDKENECKENK